MSRAEEYRRLARECLATAHMSRGEKRGMLIDLAQTWLRLAEEQETAGSPSAVGESRPVLQQQQQVQPESDDDKR